MADLESVSLKEEEVTKVEINDANESPSKNEKDSPKTAKDLFSVFAPDSESESVADEEKDDDYDENLEEPSKKKKKQESGGKKKYLQKYQKKWNDVPAFKPWLSPSVHGDIYFYCKFCKKDYKCGKSEIVKHMASKKHKQHTTPVQKAHKKFSFRGLLCPVFTPFRKTKLMEVNYKVIGPYATFLNTCGIKGILINDIVGEGTALTITERMAITEEWAKYCQRNGQFLMVQCGGAPIKDVIEMVQHAQTNKVGAVVLMPDLYCRPRNHLDVIKYIKVIAEASKDIPILYHHNAKYSLLEFDMANFLLDITGEIDSFVGLIHSTNDLGQVLSSNNVNQDQFTVFMGTDECILGAAASNLTCIMGSSINIFPNLVESICTATSKGEIQTAQKAQSVLSSALFRIKTYGDRVPCLKAAMCLISKINIGPTREPFEMIWDGNVDKMKTELKDLGLI